MKIPKKYTETQTLKIIDKICKKLAPKNTFGIYDSDDIKQEAFIIALTGLEEYSEQADLEPYLYQYIKDRLKNLKRKKFSRQHFNCNKCEKFNPFCSSCLKRENTELSKRNLSNPIDIHSMDPTKESSIMTFDNNNDLDLMEINQVINKKLPVDMREDYLKIKDGMYVEKNRRILIEQTVIDIIQDYI